MREIREAEFDFLEGLRRKRDGIGSAEEAREEALAAARAVARVIAERVGTVTADDCQRELRALGYTAEDLGNAAGAIFKGSEWIPTGERRRSARVARHAGEQKVWRLRTEEDRWAIQ